MNLQSEQITHSKPVLINWNLLESSDEKVAQAFRKRGLIAFMNHFNI